MALIFELGTSSADAITLRPNYDYKGDKLKIEDEMRSKSAKLYVYKWADYLHVEFTTDYVLTANAAIVNSWWDTNTELLLFITSGSTVEVNSVMLRGKNPPLNEYNPPGNQYRKGKIVLEGY